VQLIRDGDVAAVIATAIHGAGVDVYMGIGGAPEGVLAAAALCSTGGQMCGRLLFANEDEKNRARRLGIQDFNRQYHLNDLAKGDVMFAATGVTDGSMLKGVRLFSGGAITESVVMRARTRTTRKIETKHNFSK
jgi:fructose-1,6-bisphosphatase II / sedoheptulose-1,7-bisphosphatase